MWNRSWSVPVIVQGHDWKETHTLWELLGPHAVSSHLYKAAKTNTSQPYWPWNTQVFNSILIMDVLTREAPWLLMPVTVYSVIYEPSLWAQPRCSMPWVCWISCDEAGLLVACGADWAAAWGDVMGCRNSKVLPEPPGDVLLDLVKKVSMRVLFCLPLTSVSFIIHLLSIDNAILNVKSLS